MPSTPTKKKLHSLANDGTKMSSPAHTAILRLFGRWLILWLAAQLPAAYSQEANTPHIIDIEGNVRFEYLVSYRGGDEYQIFVSGVPIDNRKSCHLFRATAISTTSRSEYSNGKLEGVAAIIVPGTAFPVTITLTDVRVGFFDDWYQRNRAAGMNGASYGNPCTEMKSGRTLRATGQIMYASGQPCDGIALHSNVSGDLTQYLKITRQNVTVVTIQKNKDSFQSVTSSKSDIDRNSFHVEQVDGKWQLIFQTARAALFAKDSNHAPYINTVDRVEVDCADNGDMGHVIELLRNPDLP